jgi:hypothetical protein
MQRRVLFAGLTAAALLILLFLSLRMVLPGLTRIDLAAEGGKGKRISVLLRDGDPVTLTWRNSQFGLRVEEVYMARNGLLIQDQVIFSDPKGLPPPEVSPRDVDDLFHTGGAFAARGLNRPFSRIVFRVGEIGDPKMEAGGRTVYFKKEAGFGGRVILAVSRADLYDRLFSR